eukprot:COSAG01_NODE_2083_length_8462_cov_17.020567_7_plen_1842_part_01
MVPRMFHLRSLPVVCMYVNGCSTKQQLKCVFAFVLSGPKGVKKPHAGSVGPSLALKCGKSACEYQYTNIPGTNVANLLTSKKFIAGKADHVVDLTDWRESSGFFQMAMKGDNLGVMMEGWLLAPQTGMYTFSTQSDDSSEVWIASKPDDKVGLIKVVELKGCCRKVQGTVKVALRKGESYYLRVFVKEGSGAEYGKVGMRVNGMEFFPIPIGLFHDPSLNGVENNAGITGMECNSRDLGFLIQMSRCDANPATRATCEVALAAKVGQLCSRCMAKSKPGHYQKDKCYSMKNMMGAIQSFARRKCPAESRRCDTEPSKSCWLEVETLVSMDKDISLGNTPTVQQLGRCMDKKALAQAAKRDRVHLREPVIAIADSGGYTATADGLSPPASNNMFYSYANIAISSANHANNPPVDIFFAVASQNPSNCSTAECLDCDVTCPSDTKKTLTMMVTTIEQACNPPGLSAPPHPCATTVPATPAKCEAVDSTSVADKNKCDEITALSNGVTCISLKKSFVQGIPASCTERAGASVAVDTAACANVKNLADNKACNLVQLSAPGTTGQACQYTPEVVGNAGTSICKYTAAVPAATRKCPPPPPPGPDMCSAGAGHGHAECVQAISLLVDWLEVGFVSSAGASTGSCLRYFDLHYPTMHDYVEACANRAPSILNRASVASPRPAWRTNRGRRRSCKWTKYNPRTKPRIDASCTLYAFAQQKSYAGDGPKVSLTASREFHIKVDEVLMAPCGVPPSASRMYQGPQDLRLSTATTTYASSLTRSISGDIQLRYFFDASFYDTSTASPNGKRDDNGNKMRDILRAFKLGPGGKSADPMDTKGNAQNSNVQGAFDICFDLPAIPAHYPRNGSIACTGGPVCASFPPGSTDETQCPVGCTYTRPRIPCVANSANPDNTNNTPAAEYIVHRDMRGTAFGTSMPKHDLTLNGASTSYTAAITAGQSYSEFVACAPLPDGTKGQDTYKCYNCLSGDSYCNTITTRAACDADNGKWDCHHCKCAAGISQSSCLKLRAKAECTAPIGTWTPASSSCVVTGSTHAFPPVAFTSKASCEKAHHTTWTSTPASCSVASKTTKVACESPKGTWLYPYTVAKSGKLYVYATKRGSIDSEVSTCEYVVQARPPTWSMVGRACVEAGMNASCKIPIIDAFAQLTLKPAVGEEESTSTAACNEYSAGDYFATCDLRQPSQLCSTCKRPMQAICDLQACTQPPCTNRRFFQLRSTTLASRALNFSVAVDLCAQGVCAIKVRLGQTSQGSAAIFVKKPTSQFNNQISRINDQFLQSIKTTASGQAWYTHQLSIIQGANAGITGIASMDTFVIDITLQLKMPILQMTMGWSDQLTSEAPQGCAVFSILGQMYDRATKTMKANMEVLKVKGGNVETCAIPKDATQPLANGGKRACDHTGKKGTLWATNACSGTPCPIDIKRNQNVNPYRSSTDLYQLTDGKGGWPVMSKLRFSCKKVSGADGLLRSYSPRDQKLQLGSWIIYGFKMTARSDSVQCRKSNVRSCDDTKCVPKIMLGDGVCDAAFNCKAFDFDDLDCIASAVEPLPAAATTCRDRLGGTCAVSSTNAAQCDAPSHTTIFYNALCNMEAESVAPAVCFDASTPTCNDPVDPLRSAGAAFCSSGFTCDACDPSKAGGSCAAITTAKKCETAVGRWIPKARARTDGGVCLARSIDTCERSLARCVGCGSGRRRIKGSGYDCDYWTTKAECENDRCICGGNLKAATCWSKTSKAACLATGMCVDCACVGAGTCTTAACNGKTPTACDGRWDAHWLGCEGCPKANVAECDAAQTKAACDTVAKKYAGVKWRKPVFTAVTDRSAAQQACEVTPAAGIKGD